MDRRSDEILILRRFSGYLRFHIPPLIYSPKSSHLLQKKLLSLEGVRKVTIKKELGKLSVHYDAILVRERDVLVAIDEVSTRLLKRVDRESYEVVLSDAEKAHQRRLIRKAVVTVILVYLVRVHWRLISQQWVRDPVTHWPKLLAIATLLYIHRKHIREAPNFD